MRIKGHDSFSLRRGWLYKGIKNIQINNRLFNESDSNACEVLGLGSNMVKSLRFWLKATDLIKDERIGNLTVQVVTDFGQLIDRYDRYYEEQGTNFLVHYKLVTNEDLATAWYWFFNLYQGMTMDRKQFSADNGEFVAYLKHAGFTGTMSPKNLEDEFACLVRTYYNRAQKEESPEETKICPLSELNLLTMSEAKSKEYKKISPSKDEIHPMIIYAVMVDNLNGRTEIPIDALRTDAKNIGRVFNLDRSVLIYVLEKIESMGYIEIVRTAGLDVVKIKEQEEPLDFLRCAELYYRDLVGGEV